MEAIRKIECPELFSRSNFRQRDYVDDRGKLQPMYEITRDGFSFLAMGFTGKKAAHFKIQFIEAFNKMESAILYQKNLSWQQERANGKVSRHCETDAIARFIEYAAAQGSQQPRMYYVNFTKMVHCALDFARQAAPPTLRDSLDAMQLNFLATAEYLITAALDEGMATGKNYKDIYQATRNKVIAFAASLPLQHQIPA